MRTSRLRHVFRVVNGGTPTPDPDNWDGGIPWATPIDLGRDHGRVLGSTGRTLTTRGLHSGSTLVPAASLIVSTRAPIGYVAQTTVPTAFNQGCRGLMPVTEVDARFFRYQISALTSELQSRGQGSTFAELSTEALANLQLSVPDLGQQRAIADYLDIETARNDEVIAVRRRQLAVMDERITASVWIATTKGIDRSALRPSGIGWVGDMPAHWGLPTVGSNFEVQLGKMLSPEASASGDLSPYLRNVNVQWDRIDTSDLNAMHFDASDRLRYRLRPGDLLVCEGGEVGRAAIWSGELEGCYYQKALHRLRPLRPANARFLMYALWAASSRSVFEIEGNSSTIVHLTAEKLRAHRLPWPPLAEQDEIVAALDLERSRAGRFRLAIESQITLLLERRQALITAAVTGQIDIPGAAA